MVFFHSVFILLIVCCDNIFRVELAELNLSFPIFYILVTIVTLYLYFKAGQRPGIVGFQKGRQFSSIEVYPGLQNTEIFVHDEDSEFDIISVRRENSGVGR